MQFSNAIRQRIINLTKDKHMNFSDLSRISQVKYTTLISFINGKNKTLTLDTLFDLCVGLEIELVDFFDNELFIDVVDEHEKSRRTF